MASDMGGVWRTVGGRRIFIKDGQSLSEAMRKSGKFGKNKTKSKNEINSIKKFEENIQNNDTEILGVFDKNGNLVFSKTENQKNLINITIEEGKLLKDNVFTHNHPSGTTFSQEDIDTAFRTGVKEIRAVHSNGRYSLKRMFKINDIIPEKYFNFAKDYDQAVKNYMKNTVDNIYKKTKNANHCNKMVEDYREKWLTENSEEYGWRYKNI